jgi:hypothetical protein
MAHASEVWREAYASVPNYRGSGATSDCRQA